VDDQANLPGPDFAGPAASFGSAADVYERGRPGYPGAALDWLLPAGRPRVVDLGAGTGKLTRQLHARGLAVTAVDPSDGMLAQLRAAVPGVPALRGSAEDIPLPDASADVVLVAQAWHWVDAERAVPEVARVLSPGGRLGLIWNQRDERVAWIRRLGEIIGRPEHGHDATSGTPGSALPTSPLGSPFGALEIARFGWSMTLGTDRLLDLVASRSRVILLPRAERAAVLSEVRRLAATHPELVGRTEFELPYVTECARASRP
jgi:SAM-dependent methyltransferase